MIRRDQRNQLPRWFDQLQRRMRVKEKVRNTKGTDGQSLVMLIDADDHPMMIRLFFATKVWIMKERIALGT